MFLPHPSTQPFDHKTSFETANMVGIVLSNIAYGFHIAIFMFLMRLHCLRPPRKPSRKTRRNWSLIAYAIPLFFLATIGLCLQTWLNHRAFILHWDYSNGPLAYIADTSRDGLSLSTTAVYVVLNWYADGMTLYRFYQVFSFTRWAKTASIAMLFSLVGLGVTSMLNISQLMENMWTNAATFLTLAYLGLSLSINIALTGAIILRLLWFDHKFRKSYDNRENRVLILAVYLIVESALPYTVVAILTVVACGINHPMKNALLPLLGQLQAIPPMLLLVGVKWNRVFADIDSPASPAQTALHFVANPTISESTATTDKEIRDDTEIEPPLSQPKPCLSPRSSMIYEIRKPKAEISSFSAPNGHSSSSLSLQDSLQTWCSSNNDEGLEEGILGHLPLFLQLELPYQPVRMPSLRSPLTVAG